MSKLKLFFALVIVAWFMSCNRKIAFESNTAIKDNLWNFKDTLIFDANIADTISPYNIYLNIRTSTNYPYSNIYLFITTYAPNGNQLKDTFNIQLTDDSGKWFGKGIGSIYSLQVPYKKNIKFPFRGIYTFNVQHGMWNEELPGVTDIGIRVENMN